MGHRLSKIYTRTGDKGETGMGNGQRIAKDAPRIEAIGAIDETNSTIGLIMAQAIPQILHDQLLRIQHDLFDLGGELSIPGYDLIKSSHSERLEQWLDEHNESLPMLKEFILPSGGPATAACHMARATCRRAERRVVSLSKLETVSAPLLQYLNRLSDYLFVLSRVIVRHENGSEVLWQRGE